MDVQMADVQIAAVQSNLQPPSERVPYQAALQVVPYCLSLHGLCPRRSRMDSRCRSISPHRVLEAPRWL